MCCTMLYMLERMQKGNYRIGTPKTRGLSGLPLSIYVHGENLYVAMVGGNVLRFSEMFKDSYIWL